MELGCGVGNTVFPILEMHPKCHMYAADFSPTAVQLVKEHKDYQNGRCTAFVLDMTDEEGWDKVTDTIDQLVKSELKLSV